MYNNYLNNPYYNPNFRPIEQPYQTNGVNMQPIQQQPLNMPKSVLQGKQVDSLDVVRASEVPLDGSITYFALTDGTAIATKQLQTDGTSKIVVFKPIEQQNEEKRYITQDDLDKVINGLNLDEIDDIKEEIKDIRKQLKKKGE